MDLLNAVILLLNYIIVPALSYGSQLALGAIFVTLIYGILRFANFATGDMMSFGTMFAVLLTFYLQSIGVSLGFANTVNSDLNNALLVGPLLRFRPKSGWGFEGAGEWFSTTIRKSPVGEPWSDTRLQVRPIMGGVAYNVVRERLSMAFSVTGGLSFNGLNVDTECACENKATDVNKSLIGRTGVSIWYDITSRMSFNIVGGYIVNRPEVTFSSNGITKKAVINGDTAVVSAGIAFWIF